MSTLVGLLLQYCSKCGVSMARRRACQWLNPGRSTRSASNPPQPQPAYKTAFIIVIRSDTTFDSTDFDMLGGVLYCIGTEQGMECCWSYPPRFRVGVHASIKFHSKVTTEIQTTIRLVQLFLFVRRDTLMRRCHSSPLSLQYHLWLYGVLRVICADCGPCSSHILPDSEFN